MDGPFIATLEAIRLSDTSRNGSFPIKERQLLSIMEKIKGRKTISICFSTLFSSPVTEERVLQVAVYKNKDFCSSGAAPCAGSTDYSCLNKLGGFTCAPKFLRNG